MPTPAWSGLIGPRSFRKVRRPESSFKSAPLTKAHMPTDTGEQRDCSTARPYNLEDVESS